MQFISEMDVPLSCLMSSAFISTRHAEFCPICLTKNMPMHYAEILNGYKNDKNAAILKGYKNEF